MCTVDPPTSVLLCSRETFGEKHTPFIYLEGSVSGKWTGFKSGVIPLVFLSGCVGRVVFNNFVRRNL
jgi:hypothetical protein